LIVCLAVRRVGCWQSFEAVIDMQLFLQN
jgi:hypothetical protein